MSKFAVGNRVQHVRFKDKTGVVISLVGTNSYRVNWDGSWTTYLYMANELEKEETTMLQDERESAVKAVVAVWYDKSVFSAIYTTIGGMESYLSKLRVSGLPDYVMDDKGFRYRITLVDNSIKLT
jgi:hypothetical protein